MAQADKMQRGLDGNQDRAFLFGNFVTESI